MQNFGDQLSIDTPELVSLEFPLAGLGSRFVALFVDYCLQGFALLALFFVLLLFVPSLHHFRQSSSKWVMAVAILVPFLLYWMYFALFEAFWRGQTPGKRVAKIRVIQESGRAVGLFEALARNLLRAIDILPGPYLVGAITIFVNPRNQRLGDMVAGTLVVHEVQREAGDGSFGMHRMVTSTVEILPTAAAPRSSNLPAHAVARLSLSDLTAIETFLERRFDMTLEVRSSLAQRLARNMAARMQEELPPGIGAETFLEDVAYSMRASGRMHR